MAFDSPRTPALCTILTGGDHAAAMLLHRMHELQRFAKATIPDVPGTWIAHSREWWAREAQLSLRQLDRALAKLDGRGLIERRKWWWDNRLSLFVRLTEMASRYLHHEHSWDSATQAIEVSPSGRVRLTEFGKSMLPDSATSNDVAISDKTMLPDSATSNEQQDKQQDNQKDGQAHKADAMCAKSASLSEKVPGKANLEELNAILGSKIGNA